MSRDTLRQVISYPGLSKKEAEVYLACLETRKPTALSVSRETFVPRQTVQRIMDDLVSKGLMGKIQEGKKTIYVPEDPRSLVTKLELHAGSIKDVMGELRSLATIYQNRPTMRFFEGEDGIRKVFQDILSVNEKEIYAFSSVKELLATIPDYTSIFMRPRIRRKIFAKIISPKDDEGVRLKYVGREEFREIRFITDALADKIGIIGGHIFIYGNNVAFISFDRDRTSVIIENRALAKTHSSLFQIAWELLGPNNK